MTIFERVNIASRSFRRCLLSLALASLMPCVALAQSPMPFDGAWSVRVDCPEHVSTGRTAKAWSTTFPVMIEKGRLEGRKEAVDDVNGSHHLHGTVDAQGKATMRYEGVIGIGANAIGRKGSGAFYSQPAIAQFEANSAKGSRIAARTCDLTFTKGK
jgi:hypothetical protein